MPQTKPPSASTQPTSELQPTEPVYVRRVSRSSSSPPERSERAFVSMYSKDALTSEASELCFEEVQARLDFQKRQQQREAEERLGYKCGAEHLERKDDEAISRLRHQVHEMSRKVVISSTMVCHQGPQEGWSETQCQENLNATQQNVHVSHITPSNSLRSQHATAMPSHVTPSPTVNTRQALDVIMGMFHAGRGTLE
ncbi:uncharacterized protein LOC144010704 isoform X2 [Festucalex cinctus]